MCMQYIQCIQCIQYIQRLLCIESIQCNNTYNAYHTYNTYYLFVCMRDVQQNTTNKQTRSNASRLGRTHPGLARTYTNANFTILQISAGVANQFCSIVEYQLHIQYINAYKTHNVYNTHKAATVRSNRQAHLATANSTFYPESFSWLP